MTLEILWSHVQGDHVEFLGAPSRVNHEQSGGLEHDIFDGDSTAELDVK